MKLRPYTVANVARPFVQSKNCVFTLFNRLAEVHSAINLGAGTPSGLPPAFVTEALRRYTHHRTPRRAGSAALGISQQGFDTRPAAPLNDTIASIYSQRLGRELSPGRNILVTSGARDALHSTLHALLSEGDEAIVFDPSYEIYRETIAGAGATPIGIPLTPRKRPTKLDILRRQEPFRSCADDNWEIDFQRLSKSITRKTKAIILNSPHNPSGKIFSESELSTLRSILRQHKQITVVDDRVYEHAQFDDYYNMEVPRVSSTLDMFDRTVTIFSGGKLLGAHDLRCGWMIAPENLHRRIVRANCFKPLPEEINLAVSESLGVIYRTKNSYLRQYADGLVRRRKLLLQQLINSKYEFNLWVPNAGFFVLADISSVEVQDKYYQHEGAVLPKDYAFCMKLCKEDGVVAVPCSSFFAKGTNEHYIRFAFCKDEMSIMEAGRRLREPQHADSEHSMQLAVAS